MKDKIDKNEIILVSIDPDFAVLMMKLAQTEIPIKMLGRKWLIQNVSDKKSEFYHQVRAELIEFIDVKPAPKHKSKRK